MPIAYKDAGKIRAHMDDIIENFDVTDFQNKLVGKGLKLPDVSVLNQETVIHKKNRKCLEYLIKPGNENANYQVLIDLLREYKYTKVVEKLESGLPPQEATCKGSTVQRIHVPENKRHTYLTDKYLVQLSKPVSVKDKLEWATYLGVPRRDVEVIEMDDPLSTDTQMMKILFCWRNSQPRPDCTLGVLMEKYNFSMDNGVDIDTEALEGIIENIPVGQQKRY
ncbi:uncharacterized protein LOC132555184 isoform X2 [Ylistrum balloti]|uniref:uncharacterized protein LOC132555184 isoform X2 n=1 Tax=Ylistrum balloti TaxID=509963 RepID=UPI002905F040|nr:uncharacterized protein LOC132555184 isoform X2 [Ylistrum balloti]